MFAKQGSVLVVCTNIPLNMLHVQYRPVPGSWVHPVQCPVPFLPVRVPETHFLKFNENISETECQTWMNAYRMGPSMFIKRFLVLCFIS